MSIGKNIKMFRKERKLTQDKLAQKASISRSYLADVEGDRYNPSLETLRSIAEALNTSIAALTNESEQTKLLIETANDKQKRKLPEILKLIANDEGYIYEDLHRDVFNAMLNSGINMTYAFHNSYSSKLTEEYFLSYFNSEDNDHIESHKEEAIKLFNESYDLRAIRTSFDNSGEYAQELFIEELEKLLEKHNIKNSNANAKEFVRNLDLSDEELFEKYSPKMDGEPLSFEEFQDMLAYARVKRQMRALKIDNGGAR